MPHSLADLSLSFGLVSIPVKVYPATQSGGDIAFNLIHSTCGSRLKQQYVCIKENVVVDRAHIVKGYEFDDDQYVTFTPEELKALEEKGTHTVDIVAFVPLGSIDPIYFDRAYYLSPDKRGARPYALLIEGMKATGRCALARWAWHGKSYTVAVRPGPDGLILQQLLYADEVRSMKDLGIEKSDVKKPELELAKKLIEQIAQDSYHPEEFEDEVKHRIEEAVQEKVHGKKIVVSPEPQRGTAKVIDLMAALRSSLGKPQGSAADKRSAPAGATRTATGRSPRTAVVTRAKKGVGGAAKLKAKTNTAPPPAVRAKAKPRKAA